MSSVVYSNVYSNYFNYQHAPQRAKETPFFILEDAEDEWEALFRGSVNAPSL